MTIKPAPVERDEDGFWTHPEFLTGDDEYSAEQIQKWFDDNGITYFIDYFDYTATDEQFKRVFTGDVYGCSDWEPKCDREGAFLLSIHDSEDGPVAIYAVPIAAKSTSN